MRYDAFMRLNIELDRLKGELMQSSMLSNELINMWMTYASHKQTGVVYDTQVLNEQVNAIRARIVRIEEELHGESQ